MTSARAWRRRLDFRFAEVQHALATGNAEAAVDHARAAWAIALRMTAYDRAAVLALTTARPHDAV